MCRVRGGDGVGVGRRVCGTETVTRIAESRHGDSQIMAGSLQVPEWTAHKLKHFVLRCGKLIELIRKCVALIFFT